MIASVNQLKGDYNIGQSTSLAGQWNQEFHLKSVLSPGMKFLVHFREVGAGHMGINLGGGDI